MGFDYDVAAIEDYGANGEVRPMREWAFGSLGTLKVLFFSQQSTDLTNGNCTVTVYDGGGIAIIDAEPVIPVISASPDKSRASCSYMLDCTGGRDIQVAGTYTAVMAFSLGYNDHSPVRLVVIPIKVFSVP